MALHAFDGDTKLSQQGSVSDTHAVTSVPICAHQMEPGQQGFAHLEVCMRCVKNRLFFTRFPEYSRGHTAIV